MTQEQGIIGKIVGGMIHRSVKARFRNVYWSPPEANLSGPIIWSVNHHGWYDGYLMFQATQALGIPSLDWIQEFDSFPLFKYVGGMPFGADQPNIRAATIRKTIRLMKQEKRSLMLFAEGILHEAPEIMELGKSLATLIKHVPDATVIPVAIVYKMGLHERPEAYMSFGSPVEPSQNNLTLEQIRARMQDELAQLMCRIEQGEVFQVLVKGTGDVNERMKFPTRKNKK